LGDLGIGGKITVKQVLDLSSFDLLSCDAV